MRYLLAGLTEEGVKNLHQGMDNLDDISESHHIEHNGIIFMVFDCAGYVTSHWLRKNSGALRVVKLNDNNVHNFHNEWNGEHNSDGDPIDSDGNVVGEDVVRSLNNIQGKELKIALRYITQEAVDALNADITKNFG